jgi:phytoene/squalene synthetase
MNAEKQRYQAHLDRVSRSFAFCIRELSEPFRQEVSLAYLLFRLLDTIEDADWKNFQKQRASFSAFDEFLTKAPSHEQLKFWIQGFPSGISKTDAQLLEDAAWVFERYWALNIKVRTVLQKHLQNALRGMQHFVLRFKNGKEISTLKELNSYCFFVAGVIGEYLSENYAIHVESYDWKKYRRESYHFGLFLQKINILKDQMDDQKEGRVFVHDRREVLKSLNEHAHYALEYILSLPGPRDSYALFCAWSFFLGLASLPSIEKRWQAGDPSIKISRVHTLEVLAKVKWSLRQDATLRDIFAEKIHFLEELTKDWGIGAGRAPVGDGASSSESVSMGQLYEGILDSKDLKELNLALYL